MIKSLKVEHLLMSLMKVYLDESGNLGGLGSKVSEEDPYFVLAALIAREDAPIKRCIRNVRQTLKKKYKVKSELKFNESDDPSKRRILECVAKTNNDIAYVFVRKDQAALLTSYLGVEPQVLYNDICKQLLQRVIPNYEFPKGAVEIVIDRFLYGDAQERFDNYLATGLMRSINVSHLDSKQCPCLQAVDFIAGAIARKYRDNDDLYYNKIQHKITMAFEFFESK
jgi:hypothetical protein